MVLDEDVGGGDETAEDLGAGGGPDVERHAPLAGVVVEEDAARFGIGAVPREGRLPPARVAPGRLDLDDVGPEGREELPDVGSRHHLGDLDDPRPIQRTRHGTLRLGRRRPYLPVSQGGAQSGNFGAVAAGALSAFRHLSRRRPGFRVDRAAPTGGTMTTRNDYDVIVIGAGPTGENAADVAVRHGLRVAVVESELVGGECSYWACMPSKALLRPGEALEEARRVPGAAEAVTGTVDVAAALARRDAMAGGWDDAGQVAWLDGAGIDLLRGRGRLAGERLVDVEAADGTVTRLEAARAVVVATGTGAALPPVPGLADALPWDNRQMTSAKEAPRRLLVVGGGVVGVEMAQAWKWLGSEEVTIVEMAERILAREEPFVADELGSALTRLGVTVRTGARLESVRRAAADAPVVAAVTLSDGSTVDIEADEILVAAGRRPNTSDIGAETVGLEPGRPITVNDHLQATAVPGGWLYAVGDVNGRSLLTHTGKYQARIAGAHIAGVETSAWGDTKATPRVIFTSPEIAAVGLTEDAARAAGIDVRSVTYDIGHVAGASTLGRGYSGTAKLVVDAAREVIVGATFVGPRVGEIVHAATVAIVAETPLGTLWHAVPSFPTLSEVWLRLLETYRDTYHVTFT